MEIDKFFKNYWDAQLSFSRDEVLEKLEWNHFVKVVSSMDIKSRGTKIEKRVLKQNGWVKINGRASHGDAKNGDKVVEIKSSLITPKKNSTITFRGIRKWHNVHDYYFVLIDIRKYDKNPETYVFKLSSEQIMNEVKVGTLRPYTLKAKDREGNKYYELGSSLKKDDVERWKKEYRVKSVKL